LHKAQSGQIKNCLDNFPEIVFNFFMSAIKILITCESSSVKSPSKANIFGAGGTEEEEVTTSELSLGQPLPLLGSNNVTWRFFLSSLKNDPLFSSMTP